jgi:hypothetical protein
MLLCSFAKKYGMPVTLALDLHVKRLDVGQQRVVAHAASTRIVLRSTLPTLMKAAGTDFQHLAYTEIGQ